LDNIIIEFLPIYRSSWRNML